MSPNNHLPTFNMKVVVQETGLKPDTLRAWERRYGVPNPQRTAGGHRLYSQHEIELLKWLVARQSEGLSISHAIELWQQLEQEGQNPLQADETAVSEPAAPLHITGEQVDELRQAWIAACLAFDEQQAQHLLSRAFALFPLETVCYQILQQGINEIGSGWYKGTISVQQEHFASALALRQLEALLVTMPPPTRNGRLLIGCPPTELHTLAPLIINLMLRRQGWDVVYLGANVPLDRLATAVEQIDPQLVILSAQTLVAAAHILPLAQKLAELSVPLAFGGAVFNHVQQAQKFIPGHFLGETLAQVPQTVEKLMQTTPAIGKVKKPSKVYQAAREHFIERRSAIDAHLRASPTLLDMSSKLLNDTNRAFSNNIEAALHLGDLTMVETNLDWVKGLLFNYQYRLTATTLQHYLRQYQEAVKAVMDERAAPILDWFAQLD